MAELDLLSVRKMTHDEWLLSAQDPTTMPSGQKTIYFGLVLI